MQLRIYKTKKQEKGEKKSIQKYIEETKNMCFTRKYKKEK
jgi:hypothetical protein